MLVGKKWLDDHIKTFIKPNISGGKLPDLLATDNGYADMLRKEENLKALLELWAEARKRADGRTIVLPGRDTWLLEVVARLEGHDTLFRPDISSITYSWVAKHDPDAEKIKSCYGVDSGNAGSVPKGLKCADFGMVFYNGSPQKRHQLIPHHNAGPYYNIYCVLEGGLKYWTHATLIGANSVANPTRISQKIETNQESFRWAAVHTLLVANYWLKMNPEPETTRRLKLKSALKRLETTRRTGLGISLARRRRKVIT